MPWLESDSGWPPREPVAIGAADLVPDSTADRTASGAPRMVARRRFDPGGLCLAELDELAVERVGLFMPTLPGEQVAELA